MMEMRRFQDLFRNLENIFLYILLYCKFSHSSFSDKYQNLFLLISTRAERKQNQRSITFVILQRPPAANKALESSENQILFVKTEREEQLWSTTHKRISGTSMTHLQFGFFNCHFAFWNKPLASKKSTNRNALRSFKLQKYVTRKDVQNFTLSNAGHLYTHQCHLINT